MTPGIQCRELRDLDGRKTEVLSAFAALEFDRRVVVRSKTGPGWLGVWDLGSEGSGTHLRWTVQPTMRGPSKLLESLIARQINFQITKQFAARPSLTESEIAKWGVENLI